MKSCAAAVVLVFVSLAGCSRDPNVVKRKYLESGNKYFDRGKYKEASIMYRNALKTDQRYGDAYFKLALTDLKLGQLPRAVGSLQRAIELIPDSREEHWIASTRLAEIYLAASRDPSVANQSEQFLTEAENIIGRLLKKNPNSYDGTRLKGDLDYIRAQRSYTAGNQEESRKLLASSIAEYRKAEAAKPGQNGLAMALAKALTADRQFEAAEKLYREVLSRDKTAVLAYTELYNLYVFQNKTSEAEQVLKNGISNNPKQYAFLSLLAAHYYGMKRKDDVVRVLEQIKSHAKDFQQAYLTAGDFYLRMGEPDQAIKQYREGIANDSRQKVAYEKRIVEVLMRQGKRAEAADMNAQILKDNPKDTDARALSASLLLDKGQVQQAMSELQSVVAAAPDNFVARYNLGRAHIARGEREQARQQFNEAVRLRPDYIPARLALAELQLSTGEYDAALKSAGEVLKYDGQNAGARLVESAALMRSGKPKESRQVLEAMLKTNPNSPLVVFQLGALSLSEKNYKDAEESFRKAYQLNPSDVRGLMGVVETYMIQNKPEQALQILEQEEAKHPDRRDIKFALGNTAVRLGKFDLGIAQFQKVLPDLPKESKAAGEIYIRIGETYRRKGDLNSAVPAFQKARDLLPDNSLAVGGLAMSLDALGQKDGARQAYEQVIKLNPRDGVALNNLAFLLADTGGDLNQALTYAQRAKQILPNMSEVSDTLGWIYLKKNLSDNAIEIFRGLVAKQPSHPTYRYHLAMALSQKGDKFKAVQELQQALKDNPSKEEEARIRDLIQKLT